LAITEKWTFDCHFQTLSMDSQIPVLLAKPGDVLSIPSEHMEDPQIGFCKTGPVFRWHCDEVPPPELFNGCQQLATLLVYLNTVGA
jgi:hypothetical protein